MTPRTQHPSADPVNTKWVGVGHRVPDHHGVLQGGEPPSHVASWQARPEPTSTTETLEAAISARCAPIPLALMASGTRCPRHSLGLATERRSS